MKKFAVVLLSTIACATLANAKIVQTFEPAKDTSAFSGKPEVSFATDLSFYFQGLSSAVPGGVASVDATTGALTYPAATNIESGLILPTANFDISAKVLSGFNVKLQTMLASHHHNEAYVKGGYATIDNLDFIAPGFLSSVMQNATLKIGVNDINYGDDQYRRTDNANVMKNPFINNLAVEGYLQGTHVEFLYRLPSLNAFAMVGVTNGQANPSDVSQTNSAPGSGSSDRYALYGKVGFDKQMNEDLRVRLTESVFFVEGINRLDLYSSDKAGDVVRQTFGSTGTAAQGAGWNIISAFASGTELQANAAAKTTPDLLASKTNLFLKYQDTEFYGLYEIIDASDVFQKPLKATHYAVDLVQRFSNDKFWLAARYENAVQEYADAWNDFGDAELTQVQLAAGWYISKNAVAKLEYIDQERKNFSIYKNGKGSFDGYMISASLSF